MSRYKLLLLAVLACGIGCGGGGGDECDNIGCAGPDPDSIVDPTALLGSYDINLSLVSNSCFGTSPLKSLHEKYVVTSGPGYHGITTIYVSGSNGVNYSQLSTTDATDGQSYFVVPEEGGGYHDLPNFAPGATCTEAITLTFSILGPNHAYVARHSDIFCLHPSDQFSAGCTVEYSGEGSFAP